MRWKKQIFNHASAVRPMIARENALTSLSESWSRSILHAEARRPTNEQGEIDSGPRRNDRTEPEGTTGEAELATPATQQQPHLVAALDRRAFRPYPTLSRVVTNAGARGTGLRGRLLPPTA